MQRVSKRAAKLQCLFVKMVRNIPTGLEILKSEFLGLNIRIFELFGFSNFVISVHFLS